MKLEMTRRQLLKVLGGGILVAAIAPDAIAKGWAQGNGVAIPQEIGAWIHIAKNGLITVLTGKTEVGQNARTSMAQAAAEELHVPVEMVNVTMADTDLVPFDMGTFGSRTTPTMVPQVRSAAASARELLLDLAARKWGVEKSTLMLQEGKVLTGDKSATYGEVVQAQSLDKQIDKNVPLTPPSEWKVLGTSVKKVDGRSFVTGEHAYASDMSKPGMLHAKVLRSPSFGAHLLTVDTSEAEGMPGVKVLHDGDFVCVAAPTVRGAQRALSQVNATWDDPGGPSSKNLEALLRGSHPLPPAATGDKALTATYTCQYIAHTPLEPRAAFADWDGKKMTVYTGSQRPFAVRDEVAKALDLPISQVRVIIPDTGSGYGGKHTGEAAVEAARMSKFTGRPVKIVWTRVEEFTWAYFRPGGVVDVASGISKDGSLTAWEYHNYNSGNPGIETPYNVPSPKSEFHESPTPLRQGSYRALAATFNNFARETHMDELAHLAEIDPVDFRLKNLRNDRLAAVLKAAAEKIGWGNQKLEIGHGLGIACATEKGGYISTAVEVAVDPTVGIRVLRAVSAFECGAILNPDLLRNQVEGALIMGLGGALWEAVEFDGGRILNAHLSRYHVPRFSAIPSVESVLIDRKDLPSAGAGECPIICIAPAIGNAVFNATGKRLRSMPLKA